MEGKKGGSLAFVHGDMLKEDISDADVVYMCSTCFGKDLLSALTERFKNMKNGSHILSLKELPQELLESDFNKLHLVDTNFYPMTWANSSAVLHYSTENNVQQLLTQYYKNLASSSAASSALQVAESPLLASLPASAHRPTDIDVFTYVVNNKLAEQEQAAGLTSLVQTAAETHLSWTVCEQDF